MTHKKEIPSTNPGATVFEYLLKPIDDFLKKQDANLKRHHNQKLSYYAFIRLLIYFFVAEGKSFKLFIETKLNKGLLPAELNLTTVPYTTINEAFEHFSIRLFREVFQHILKTVPFRQLPELATLGTFYCIDGSLFPVINSMRWAEYTSKHQSLKLHLCFELNRMIAVEFLVSAANYSERQALFRMLKSGVTYIADRGYMSFQVCHQMIEEKAYFIFRVKAGLRYGVTETLQVGLPEKVQAIFSDVRDELIRYKNDKFKHTYRLVSFKVGSEAFFILTNRLELTTFQVIMLYAYRWKVELLFRFLKRTMNGIHLIKHEQHGVTIQFYVILIVALLQLYLKQSTSDLAHDGNNASSTGKNGSSTNHQKTDTSEHNFFDSIGENLNKYWKIGIHWLTALRSLFAEPFDRRAIEILNNN